MNFTSKKPSNYKTLMEIQSKSRKIDLPENIRYIIIYTFLYKFCSDNLKDHFLLTLRDKEMTFYEAYDDDFQKYMFKDDAYHLYGYFLDKPEAFIDELISNSDDDKTFLKNFFTIFEENIKFYSKNKEETKYYESLFKIFREEIDISTFTDEETGNVVDLILLISKLDVFENEFSYSNVFEILSQSRIMRVKSNPEYITQIMSSLLVSEKTSFNVAYDPFMKNISSLFDLYSKTQKDFNYYGKEENKLTYCFSIVKLILNYYSLNSVCLKNEDALDSVDINGALFDVIMTRVPVSIKNYPMSNRNQNLEMSKRNQKNKLEEVLLKNFKMSEDSFSQDIELNNALQSLVEKMDVDIEVDDDFTGEYESLKDSEFLFLINLIECLKDDGIMTVSISQNFLLKNSLTTLRKYLVDEKNYIDTIISLPTDINRIRPEVVIVFKKNRENRDILFIDMSKKYETKRLDLLVPGLFRRNLILADETISKMKNVFENRLTVNKFSNLISIDEISNNQYNLAVSRYVDTFEGEFIKLEDLAFEKKEIENNLRDLNLKIGKMMDDLNIKF